MDESIIPWLFGVTLLAVIVWGAMQLVATRRAQRNHEHSAMPEPAARTDASRPSR